MELKNVQIMKESFISGMGIIHLEMLTNENKIEHCFLGISTKSLNEEDMKLEDWFKLFHPFTNKDNTRMCQSLVPPPEREGILWRKFEL